MTPVFIGGCDRSGTTLLGSILGAHDACLCVPESQFIIRGFRRIGFKNNNIDIPKAFGIIRKEFRFKLWSIDPAHIQVSNISPSDYSELIKTIVAKYGEQVNKYPVSLWIDHTPSNITNAKYLFDLFPQGKFIHIIRDGRAVAASIIPLDWGPNTPIRAAHWWLKNIAVGLAAEAYFSQKRMMRIRYEDLLEYPKTTISSICSFLGIDYQKTMLNSDGFSVPQYTLKHHGAVGKSLDLSRKVQWKNELTYREIELFESITKQVLVYLGYDLEYRTGAKMPTRFEEMKSLVFDNAYAFINKYKKKKRKTDGLRV